MLHGNGMGPLDAAVHALGLPVQIVGYDENACGAGSDASAIAYLELTTPGWLGILGRGGAIEHHHGFPARAPGLNRAIRANALEHRASAAT